MSITKGVHRTRFDELKPGDRIEVQRGAPHAASSLTATTTGVVIRTEHRRHGMHPVSGASVENDDDVILLELPDGELTAVTVDRSTVLRPA